MDNELLTTLTKRKMKFRPSFGLIMKEMLAAKPELVFLVADSARACRFVCPKGLSSQVVECGIAEQNMIGVAAGLAHCGKKPVVFAFSPFASERCFEQVRLDAAYSELNVVIVGGEGGVAMGTQGVTHFGWEDIAVMRSLPNMTVLCPADHLELYKCLELGLTLKGPVYIRLTGGVPEPVHGGDYRLELGKAMELRSGKDACVIAIGTMAQVALKAANLLKKEGVDVGVLNMSSIKPLDEEAVRDKIAGTRALITLEEHSIVNGLGTAVAEVVASSQRPVRLRKLGLPDRYPHEVSPYPQMLADYGLTPEAVAREIRDTLQ